MTARAKSSSGTIKIASGRMIGMYAGSRYDPDVRVSVLICPVIEIADDAINRPTRSAPASPMNIFAGCQLNGRNPAHAPIRMALMSAARLKNSDWRDRLVMMKLYTKKALFAMSTTPATRPSRPSMKLTAFITSTTTSTVRTRPSTVGTTVTPPIGTVSNCTPCETRMPPAMSCPASLVIQSRSQMSSATPISTMTRDAMRMPMTGAGSEKMRLN